MRATVETIPPRIAEIFNKVEQLTSTERLTLAKLLLESVLAGEPGEEADWVAMSLSTFQRDWDNAEDAIYDNWRERYGVPAR
jgi:hypothetical protein